MRLQFTSQQISLAIEMVGTKCYSKVLFSFSPYTCDSDGKMIALAAFSLLISPYSKYIHTRKKLFLFISTVKKDMENEFMEKLKL